MVRVGLVRVGLVVCLVWFGLVCLFGLVLVCLFVCLVGWFVCLFVRCFVTAAKFFSLVGSLCACSFVRVCSFVGLFVIVFVEPLCSTSPPGGNQVDGLPPV